LALLDVSSVRGIETIPVEVSRLRAAGVVVVARRQAGLMHHKFAVLDGRMLVTGSFNWTNQVGDGLVWHLG